MTTINSSLPMPSLIQTSYQGMQRGSQQVHQAAQHIASELVPDAKELISLNQGEKLYQANAKVLSVGSQLLGQIIDIEV